MTLAVRSRGSGLMVRSPYWSFETFRISVCEVSELPWSKNGKRTVGDASLVRRAKNDRPRRFQVLLQLATKRFERLPIKDVSFAQLLDKSRDVQKAAGEKLELER